jgi:hypothetical protein
MWTSPPVKALLRAVRPWVDCLLPEWEICICGIVDVSLVVEGFNISQGKATDKGG